MKYLGELYIYRVIGSGIIFDALWSLASFGHCKYFCHSALCVSTYL
jgi:hypothetical protein